MLITIGIILWFIIGFFTYIWLAKLENITYFSWDDFLFTTLFGLISFCILAIVTIIDIFPVLMEKLLNKLNK
jgi:hypothetical protein